ncbi:MAG: SRPBCC family protein [Planctomycetota bacterium]
MAAITVQESIAAPPEEVFAVGTNIPAWAEVIPAITKIEMLTEEPIGVGTRFIETRMMFGREASETMEVAEFEPPSHYVLVAESHGCRYRTEIRFEAEGDGTRMSFNFNAQPLTLFAKVMGFIMKPMMKKVVKLCAKDLQALKERVESKGQPSEAATV